MQNAFQKLTQARWFPTISKPLLGGLLTSGVVFGLHAAGITSFTSNEANAAITPLAGFLVSAMVDRSKGDQPDQPPDPTGPSLGTQLVDVMKQDIAEAIDADPTVFRGMLAQALEQSLHPKVVVSLPTAPPPPTDPGYIR